MRKRLNLWANRTDRLPVVTVVVVPNHIAWIEVQVVSVATIARIKRTRPVVTVTARIVKIAIVAIASRRKKKQRSIKRRRLYFLEVKGTFLK